MGFINQQLITGGHHPVYHNILIINVGRRPFADSLPVLDHFLFGISWVPSGRRYGYDMLSYSLTSVVAEIITGNLTWKWNVKQTYIFTYDHYISLYYSTYIPWTEEEILHQLIDGLVYPCLSHDYPCLSHDFYRFSTSFNHPFTVDLSGRFFDPTSGGLAASSKVSAPSARWSAPAVKHGKLPINPVKHSKT